MLEEKVKILSGLHELIRKNIYCLYGIQHDLAGYIDEVDGYLANIRLELDSALDHLDELKEISK